MLYRTVMIYSSILLFWVFTFYYFIFSPFSFLSYTDVVVFFSSDVNFSLIYSSFSNTSSWQVHALTGDKGLLTFFQALIFFLKCWPES